MTIKSRDELSILFGSSSHYSAKLASRREYENREDVASTERFRQVITPKLNILSADILQAVAVAAAATSDAKAEKPGNSVTKGNHCSTTL